MYRYKIDRIFPEIVPVIEIETIPLNPKGFADILSINLEYNIKLKRCKNRIDGLESYQWETVKKAINPYEYIYAYYGGGGDSRSVAAIKPLSRSFFKMIEMIHEFFKELVENISRDPGDQLISLHVAEGPGGFIEAVRYIRASCKNDYAIGITLIDDTNRIVPSWRSSRVFLEKHPEVIISRGADGTGNIYHPENINYLEHELSSINTTPDTIPDSNTALDTNLAYLITADGGFDYSVEYNYQEQVSSKLIFCEILTALKYQLPGGGFICKFFDMITYFSIELIYLLYIFYDDIVIYKPLTSRIANSEKYIICRGFKDSRLRSAILPELFKILVEWNGYVDKTINHIFREIPCEFIEHMKLINKFIIDHQITNINNAINLSRGNQYLENKKKNMEKQIANAVEWCRKYNIPYHQHHSG